MIAGSCLHATPAIPSGSRAPTMSRRITPERPGRPAQARRHGWAGPLFWPDAIRAIYSTMCLGCRSGAEPLLVIRLWRRPRWHVCDRWHSERPRPENSASAARMAPRTVAVTALRKEYQAGSGMCGQPALPDRCAVSNASARACSFTAGQSTALEALKRIICCRQMQKSMPPVRALSPKAAPDRIDLMAFRLMAMRLAASNCSSAVEKVLRDAR